MVDESAPEPAPPSADDQAALEQAQHVLEELLSTMKVKASVVASWGELDEESGAPTVFLDVRGDDLSLLIGRRGETLGALQFMARTLLAKRLNRGVSLMVDVEGYRQRRHEQLRRMARRTAEQVVQRKRAIALEPMPPDERRIIHLELRDHPDVYTESVGEGAKRKVTIIPK